MDTFYRYVTLIPIGIFSLNLKSAIAFSDINLEDPVVTENEIAEIVAFWTGIPVTKLTKSESEQTLIQLLTEMDIKF